MADDAKTKVQTGAPSPPVPPPPYEEACAMSSVAVAVDHAEDERVDSTHPDLHRQDSQRGVLASKGSVSWGFPRLRGETIVRASRPPPMFDPPGPPESVIQAREFTCKVCNNISFVRKEDVSTYIMCPFCYQTSTVDVSKSNSMKVILFSIGVFAFVIIIVGWIIIPLMRPHRSSHGSHHHHYGTAPLSVASVLSLKRSWDYHRLPKSTLSEEYVSYLPSLTEVNSKLSGRPAVV